MLHTFDLIFFLFLPVIAFAVYAKALHVWWRGSRNQVKGHLPKAWFYALTSLALMASPLVEVTHVFDQIALFQRTFLAFCVLGGAMSLRGLAFIHQHDKQPSKAHCIQGGVLILIGWLLIILPFITTVEVHGPY
jgi:hypothetical protein